MQHKRTKSNIMKYVHKTGLKITQLSTKTLSIKLYSFFIAGIVGLILSQEFAPVSLLRLRTFEAPPIIKDQETMGCNGAIDLDGWNDRITIPDNSTLTMGDEITIEAWVYFRGSSNIGNLVMKGGYGYGIAITGSGYIEWWRQFTQTLGPNSATPIPLNEWTHIAVAVGEGKTRFYINGELDNEVDEAIIRNRSGALFLGTQGYCLCNNLNGRIDEFRIWNTVRTQSEIECNMNTCAPEGEGLIVHLGFDDIPGSNIASDASGNENHGQLTNMNTSSDWVVGYGGITASSCSFDCQNRTVYLNEEGSASLSLDSINFSPSDFSCEDISDNTVLQFDGDNDYVNLGALTPSIIEGDFTIESYFRIDDSATRGLITAFNSNTGGWAIMQDGTSMKFILGTSSSSQFSDEVWSNELTLNRWYHIAGVKQGNTLKIYIDGVFIQSAETDYIVPDLPVYLGRRYIDLNNGWFHNGAMDELRIWNTARSQSEIQAQMASPLQGDEPNLVAYYDFEDGSGSTTLTDKTGNANEGSLTGMDVEEVWEKGGPENLNTIAVTASTGGNDCQIRVRVVDTIPPVLICKDTTVLLTDSTASIHSHSLITSASDNCSTLTIRTDTLYTFGCDQADQYTIQLTAEDESGNIAGCISKVEVKDMSPPTLICKDTTLGVAVNAQGFMPDPLLLLDTVQTSDNCGIADVEIEGGGIIDCEAGNSELIYMITGTDHAGNISSCESTVMVTEYILPPKPWQYEDIGYSYLEGTYRYYPCENLARVTSATNGVYYEEDAQSFAYRKVCGPIAMVQAKIDSISGEGYSGVMLRQSTAPESPQVSILTSGSSLLRMEYRTVTGGTKEVTNLWAPFSRYFRLVKHPNRVEVQTSQNGNSFQIIGQIDIQMGDCIEAGVTTLSLVDGEIVTGTFSKVKAKAFPVGALLQAGIQGEGSFEEAPLAMEFFPNPGRNERRLRLTRPLHQAARIMILNELGQHVSDIRIPVDQQNIDISLQGLPAGLYIARLFTDDKQLAAPVKLIKMD